MGKGFYLRIFFLPMLTWRMKRVLEK